MESNEVITTNGKILSIEELQSEVDSLTNQITLLVHALAEKVDKKEVISAINLSKEGIHINADKIQIGAETMIAEGSIASRHIISLDGSKVKAETLSVISTKLGRVEITPQANDGKERKSLSEWRKEKKTGVESKLDYKPIPFYHPTTEVEIGNVQSYPDWVQEELLKIKE